jgi:hypothetical protein
LGNLLFAPTTTKSKTKQQKKTPTSPDLTPEGTTAPQPKGWENKTSTTGDQWDDESHPSPHGLEGRPAPGGGDVSPPPQVKQLKDLSPFLYDNKSATFWLIEEKGKRMEGSFYMRIGNTFSPSELFLFEKQVHFLYDNKSATFWL